MINKLKISDYTDMSEKSFNKALMALNYQSWKKDPEKALKNAGIHLKQGISIQLVSSEREAATVLKNTLPLMVSVNKVKQIRPSNLNQVTGGLDGNWWKNESIFRHFFK